MAKKKEKNKKCFQLYQTKLFFMFSANYVFENSGPSKM